MKGIIKGFYGIVLCGMLSGCFGIQSGSLDDADVFHWENDYATFPQFVQDHKRCLGVTDNPTPYSRFQKLLMPYRPYTVPKWDSIWATFESRGGAETSQRIALSVVSNSGFDSPSSYRKCMLKTGYYLLDY